MILKSKKIDRADIERLKEIKKKDIERYHFTILYTLAMRRHILEKYPNYTFIGCEAKIERKSSGKELTPDLILLESVKNIYGLFEIKTSLSDDDAILKEIKEFKRFDEELTNLPLPRPAFSECLIFSPEISDGRRVLSVISNNGIKFNKPLVIWQWTLKEDIASKEVLIVQQIFGEKSAFGELSEECDSRGISVDISNNNLLTVEREVFLFIGKKPPKEYTAVMLENHLFNKFRSKGIEKVKIDEIMELFDISFPQKLLEIRGKNHSQQYKVKREWIQEAFNLLEKAKFLEKISDDYFFKKNKTKNIEEKLCDVSAREDLKRGFSFSKSLDLLKIGESDIIDENRN